jgi:5-methylcytosine-specific restriction protein A
VPTWTADHIKPHRGDLQLFMDPANHRPVCQRCNSKLSVREQGGFR